MDWTRYDERQRARFGARYFPEPRGEHYGQLMWCKWCDRPIPEVIAGKRSTQRLWHPECKDQFFLHTRLEHQFAFLVGRDGERCAWPKCGCSPTKWRAGPVIRLTVEPGRPIYWGTPEEQAEWASRLWTRPQGRWADLTKEEWETGAQQDIDRVCALEVDHRVPLWAVAHLPDDARRAYFGPGNLWLLCPAHHRAKTAQEARLRADVRAGRAALRVIAL